ncbi:uncharacterized protein LOC135348191 [Halichondria panicea]|uniref:uncharacterized protein LOC135348191 n=1 Tax=Halichondria panicea TaxID=6063 RepID=UPI00312BC593
MAVYSWGFGKYGQLGNGLTASAETPQFVKLPKSSPLQISCGAHFTLLLCEIEAKDGTKKRQIFACGWGKHGRLGTGSEEDHTHPTELVLRDTPVQVSAGFWHAACITSEGQLYAWGYNRSHNVLGMIKEASPFETVPVQVPIECGVRFNQVACGYNYTYAIASDGSCWSWGTGAHGVLGHGDTLERTSPTKIDIPGGNAISFVGCGYSHVAVVTSDGMLLMAGRGADGALGLGGKSDRNKLSHVTGLDGIAIAKASCSLGERHAHTLACTIDGHIYSWGDGYKGKLGLGSQESKELPTKINPSSFGGECVISVVCGGIHSAAVTREGGVFTWGCGSDGRLGHPEAKGHRYLFRSDVPRRVEGLPSNCIAVDCSYYHTAALSCDI